MLKLLALERMMNKRNVIDDLKNHKIDSWSKKEQWLVKACEKNAKKNKEIKKRKKKKKQAEKANSP